MYFSKVLIDWYLQNKRDLPWRKTQNPYLIWLSEIILQQTRIKQGLPYYEAFTNAFPTVSHLANAPEEQVLKLWQGLGYYSRARNLHTTAKHIEYEKNGTFPTSYNELIKLKGVGDYTAAAIASFAFNEDVAVVDGNVFRVLARYFGLEHDISKPKTKKIFQTLADELLPKGKAGLFNQALMEFGAIQCVPKSPKCQECVFQNSCSALQKQQVDKLPIKLKKTKVRTRHLNYTVVQDINQNFVVKQRTENGIWKNLYQFPLIETESKADTEIFLEELVQKYKCDNAAVLPQYTTLHKLSHQHLHIQFFEIHTNYEIPNAVPLSEMIQKPFPIVLFNFIKKYLISQS